MKWKNILLVLALWVVAGACEKKEIPMFTTDDAGIYFQRVTSYIYGSTTENYGDSVAYSFVSAQATAKSVVLSATVRTMGKVADYDRPFQGGGGPRGDNRNRGKTLRG